MAILNCAEETLEPAETKYLSIVVWFNFYTEEVMNQDVDGTYF